MRCLYTFEDNLAFKVSPRPGGIAWENSVSNDLEETAEASETAQMQWLSVPHMAMTPQP